MSAKIVLRIKAEHDELDRVVSVVEDLGREEDWPGDLLYRATLSIEEMALNIIDHGYADETAGRGIDIVVDSGSDALVIEIKDDGPPFDPLSDAPSPDLEASIEDRAVGGLGVHLVRAMMDELSYRRDQGKNCMTLVARRAE